MGQSPTDISIHAAREGGDRDGRRYPKLQIISIHAAREGGDTGAGVTCSGAGISIHAAREGGDDGIIMSTLNDG